MPAATVILAALVGYRFYGLDGACVGAGGAWLLAVIRGVLTEMSESEWRTRLMERLERAENQRGDMSEKLFEIN